MHCACGILLKTDSGSRDVLSDKTVFQFSPLGRRHVAASERDGVPCGPTRRLSPSSNSEVFAVESSVGDEDLREWIRGKKSGREIEKRVKQVWLFRFDWSDLARSGVHGVGLEALPTFFSSRS